MLLLIYPSGPDRAMQFYGGNDSEAKLHCLILLPGLNLQTQSGNPLKQAKSISEAVQSVLTDLSSELGGLAPSAKAERHSKVLQLPLPISVKAAQSLGLGCFFIVISMACRRA